MRETENTDFFYTSDKLIFQSFNVQKQDIDLVCLSVLELWL